MSTNLSNIIDGEFVDDPGTTTLDLVDPTSGTVAATFPISKNAKRLRFMQE